MEMKLIKSDGCITDERRGIREETVIVADRPDPVETGPFKKFLRFAGPGFLISIACLDPGNLSGDIAIAQETRFRLFWVLILAHCMAYVYQSISLTIGSSR